MGKRVVGNAERGLSFVEDDRCCQVTPAARMIVRTLSAGMRSPVGAAPARPSLLPPRIIPAAWREDDYGHGEPARG